MTIRCKFKVDSITRTMHGPEEMRSVSMSPVYGDGKPDSENSKFWKWTPSGLLRFDTVNAAAADGLKLGGEYYIDITPAA
jgi:hypothetical protein